MVHRIFHAGARSHRFGRIYCFVRVSEKCFHLLCNRSGSFLDILRAKPCIYLATDNTHIEKLQICMFKNLSPLADDLIDLMLKLRCKESFILIWRLRGTFAQALCSKLILYFHLLACTLDLVYFPTVAQEWSPTVNLAYRLVIWCDRKNFLKIPCAVCACSKYTLCHQIASVDCQNHALYRDHANLEYSNNPYWKCLYKYHDTIPGQRGPCCR